MKRVFLRAFAVWLVIIVAESVHGTLRELLLRPHVGDLRARQIAVFIGVFIILGIAYAFIRRLRAETTKVLLLVGLLWVALTITFEFALGRWVLGYSWERMTEDYDLRRGGLLSFGMVVLMLAPLIAARLRGATPLRERATSI
jgi:uncharacterized membrane protein